MNKENWNILGIKDESEMSNVCWAFIPMYRLSEDFILEFQDKINWKSVSSYQTLSEDFIRKFKNKVDWDNISKSQFLSLNFI